MCGLYIPAVPLLGELLPLLLRLKFIRFLMLKSVAFHYHVKEEEEKKRYQSPEDSGA